MSNVTLHTYAEDGRLIDADLVPFLHKKLERGDKLDFTNIVEVDDAVLDALFDGWTPEQAADAIVEMSPAADAALAAWADRAEAKSPRQSGPRARRKCEARAVVRPRRFSSATRPATSGSRRPASCAAAGGAARIHRERLPVERPNPRARTPTTARGGRGRPPARARTLH